MIGKRATLRRVGNRILGSRAAYAIIGGLGFPVHMMAARPLYGTVDRFLAWVLLVVFLVVTLRFVRSRARSVPLVPLICLQYYIFYGFTQLSQERLALVGGQYVPPPAAITMALILAVSAQLLVLTGARLGAMFPVRARDVIWNKYPRPCSSWVAVAMAYAALAGAYALFSLWNPRVVPLELRRITAVILNPYLAIIVVFFLAFRRRETALWAVGTVLVILMMLVGLFSSVLEIMIVPIVLVFATAWMWGPGIRARWVIVVVLAYVALAPAKRVYREMPGPLSLSNSVWRWQQALYETWSRPGATRRSFEIGSARASGLLYLAEGIDWTPRIVPYYEGRGFSDAMLFFIPRILWLDKPEITDLVNNRWARDFGISTQEVLERTTFGLVQPLDGYLDFGIPGALAYPFVFGLILGWLFLSEAQGAMARNMVGLVFIAEFVQVLGPLQNQIASLGSLVVGTWVVMSAMQLLAARHARGGARGRAQWR